MPSYRTDHSRARGLGAAKHGAAHWLAERISSVALIPLCVWIVFAAIRLAAGDYSTAVNFVAHPLNAVMLLLLIAVGFWHMHAGVRVVIEDYIHEPVTKLSCLLLNLFVSVLFGALAAFAILKVAFTNGSF
jgi:succinate dehydrogenase / fumarate reductase membrane anchor subunit